MGHQFACERLPYGHVNNLVPIRGRGLLRSSNEPFLTAVVILKSFHWYLHETASEEIGEYRAILFHILACQLPGATNTRGKPCMNPSRSSWLYQTSITPEPLESSTRAP